MKDRVHAQLLVDRRAGGLEKKVMNEVIKHFVDRRAGGLEN